MCIYIYIFLLHLLIEGIDDIYIYIYTNRATSVNVQPPRLRKDLRTGSISRDVANFPSELCRRRSGTSRIFVEVIKASLNVINVF